MQPGDSCIRCGAGVPPAPATPPDPKLFNSAPLQRTQVAESGWFAAGPGGPHVLRPAGSLGRAGRKIVPPTSEAARMAWNASRKTTLHGQLGTGNKISTVIQYPISTQDPSNNFGSGLRKLGAEERRLMRVRIKGCLRHLKVTAPELYAPAVFKVEENLIQMFKQSVALREAFFVSDNFAEKMINQARQATDDTRGSTTKAAIKDLFQNVTECISPVGSVPNSRLGSSYSRRSGLRNSMSEPALISE